jgi:translation initiation factor 2 alpha subunit (eIF-2alpha)
MWVKEYGVYVTYAEYEKLEQHIRHMQTISTQQVEEIRQLKRDLRWAMDEILEMAKYSAKVKDVAARDRAQAWKKEHP